MDNSKNTHFQRKIFATSINLSSTFDTMNRNKLIEILKQIVDEDESVMRKSLLQNTKLMVNMNKVKATIFEINFRGPGSNGLSEVLFIIQFEDALRKLRKTLNNANYQVPHYHTKVLYQKPQL